MTISNLSTEEMLNVQGGLESAGGTYGSSRKNCCDSCCDHDKASSDRRCCDCGTAASPDGGNAGVVGIATTHG